MRDALNPSYLKQVERFLGKGASKAVAKAKALDVLLSAHRRKLRRLYVYYLEWFRHLRRDPVHQEVMNTLRRFMDEDEEAAAGSSRGYTEIFVEENLRDAFGPDEDEEEDKEEENSN